MGKKKEHLFTFAGEEYNLLDILDDKDFFYSEEDNMGIITKQGIEKLVKKFEIKIIGEPKVASFRYSYLAGNDTETIWVLCVWGSISDPKTNAVTFDVGEASLCNLKAGIGADYPYSMAYKRWIGRAVRVHVGLHDWFTEDEAAEFKKMVINSRKSGKGKKKEEKEPENIPAPEYPHVEMEEDDAKALAKQYFSGMKKEEIVKEVSKKAKSIQGMNKDAYKNAIRSILGLDEDDPVMAKDIKVWQWAIVYHTFCSEDSDGKD